MANSAESFGASIEHQNVLHGGEIVRPFFISASVSHHMQAAEEIFFVVPLFICSLLPSNYLCQLPL